MTQSIVIVGGGFSGAITAVHAMRATSTPLRIDIVEPRPHLGAGLAYSTAHPEHRLNVPSHRMIVFDEQPTHFHEWFLGQHLDRTDPESATGIGYLFASRRDFGRYMLDLMAEVQRAAPYPCVVHHHHAGAIDIDGAAGGRWRIGLADGGSLVGDAVIVCIGHTATAAPPPFATPAVLATGRVLADPWESDAFARFGPEARLLILGQGLTMGDVLSSLRVQQHRGPVVAVSRRGLLARAYAISEKTPVPFESLGDDVRASAVVRLMRRACEEAVRAGHSWNSVIETTRERGGQLWRRLSAAEQCRLIRHGRIFWDVHRYRMAPQVASAIDQAQREGRLRLVAGRVLAAEPIAGDGIEVTIRRHPRAGSELMRERFDAIVSCVGPTHDVAHMANPFVAALLQRGLAEPHPTRLGFVVDRDNRLVREARATAGLYVVGPLSRGACGDIVGVPEISRQARFVVDGLLEHLGHREGRFMADLKQESSAA